MVDYIQLKWNAHSSAFLNNLSSFRDQQVYTDVTLSCGNQFYPAHRLVLSSCSNFFARALEVINCRSPVLLLHGIEQFILERLLMFMYDGQVTIAQTDLPCFLKAARWLGLKGLDMPNSTAEGGASGKAFPAENPSGQSESAKYIQLWTQLLSPFVTTVDGTPSYEDLTIVLRQILGKSENNDEENAVGDMIVSNVTSLSKEPESRFAFDCDNTVENNLEPETVIKFESTDIQMDEDDAAHAVPSPEAIGADINLLDSDDSSDNDNNFEGWEISDTNVPNNLKNLQLQISQNTQETEKDLHSGLLPGQSTKEECWNDSNLTRKRSLRCKHCKNKFTVREKLAEHLRTHGHNFCYSCNKGFVSSKRYVLHMKLHEGGPTYFCEDCDFVTHSKRGLSLHAHAAMHGQTPLVEESNESDIKDLVENNEDHSSGSVLTCRICGFRSNHIRGFKRHITCRHSKRRWKELQVSQNVGLMESETSCSLYNCNMCNFSSTHMRGLKRHVTCKHLRPLIDDSEISQEQEEGDADAEKAESSVYKYCCKICNFTSIHRRGFRKHMSCMHNSSEIQPNQNEGEFLDADEEDSPRLALRSGRRRYDCSGCKRSFDSLTNFQEHKLLGCGRYRCKYCEVNFRASERKEYLAHIERHKMFKCSYCSYKTDRRRSLSDHMSKHTGTYRFCCPWCTFKCVRNNVLRSHINRYHGNEVSEQELANQHFLIDKDVCNTLQLSLHSKANGVNQNSEGIDKSALHLPLEKSENDVTHDASRDDDSLAPQKSEVSAVNHNLEGNYKEQEGQL